jgi:hypothetical protein
MHRRLRREKCWRRRWRVARATSISCHMPELHANGVETELVYKLMIGSKLDCILRLLLKLVSLF